MIKPYLGQCHISNCLIMREQYVFTRERMNVTHMPKLVKKNYPQQLWLPFMLAQAEIPSGKVNISKTTTEKLTQSAGIGLLLKQTGT